MLAPLSRTVLGVLEAQCILEMHYIVVVALPAIEVVISGKPAEASACSSHVGCAEASGVHVAYGLLSSLGSRMC